MAAPPSDTPTAQQGVLPGAAASADTVATELARQFAMFQQSVQQGATGAASSHNAAAATLAAALGGPAAASSSGAAATQPPAGGRPATAVPAARPAGAQPAIRPATAPRGGAGHSQQAPAALAPPPGWAKGFDTWWQPSPPAPADVTFTTPATLQAYLDTLGKALGVKVATSFEPGAVALVLKTTR